MKGNVYTLCFAGALGTICALMLTAVGNFTAKYQAANEKAEETANVLRVLGVPFDEHASAQELEKIRNANVKEQTENGQDLFMYTNPKTGKVEGLALRFAGPGLWGPVEGLLALEADRKTIRGITFYKQEETPGLGAEITSDWFRKSFVGKTIYGPDGKPGIEVAKPGGPPAVNRVDGITGATLTGDKVQAMLNSAIDTFVKEK